MTNSPETSYARTSDGVHVAFQTLGEGPFDLVCVGYGNMVSIDMRDEEPHFCRFERRLASFSRYIRFDPRGLGLSDPTGPGRPGGVEQGVDDLVSVLDAVGSERAALFAVAGSGVTALVAAATHPERVASWSSSTAMPDGLGRRTTRVEPPNTSSMPFADSVIDVSGEAEGSIDDVDLLTPSLADEPDVPRMVEASRSTQRQPCLGEGLYHM